MSRKAVTLLVTLLVLGGATAYLVAHRAPAGPTGFVTTAVRRGRIEAKVTATGTLSPLVNVTVGSQISGRVAELMADYNSIVKKGEVVARLDSSLFEAAAEQARANVLQAQGNLAKAKAQALDAGRQLRRSRELLEKKLVAQADTDTLEAANLAAVAAITAGEGDLAQAKASMRQAETNLRYCTIHSPINGIVISRSVDVGQTVAASMTAPVLFQIAEDLKKMQVDTNVSEADVGKITAGMDVTFHVDAYPTDVFHGTVRQVRNAATTVSNVVTYDAVVDVSNPDLKLKPGMTATMSFVYAESKDALEIPSAALRFIMPSDPADPSSKSAAKSGKHEHREKASIDQRTVWVMRGAPAKPEQVTIHVGISDGTSIEVIDGLAENDQVVTDRVGGSGSDRKHGPRF
ncbi:MAG: efflux RND transporter periplasmic adaptor subunit [Polyangia bacterium]